MMFDFSDILLGETETCMATIVWQEAQDYEPNNVPISQEPFEVSLQPMPPQEVERKPENLRTWIWFKAYSDKNLDIDQTLEIDGNRFRIQKKADWRSAGVYVYDLVQAPDDVQ